MSHKHYCDYAGHPWECSDSKCECFDHCVSMEDGDHGRCRIELRPCPEHEDEAAQAIAEAMSAEPDPEIIKKWRERPQCPCGCAETEMDRFVGLCLLCTHAYLSYSSEVEDRHFAFDCPGAPAELKKSARERLSKRQADR